MSMTTRPIKGLALALGLLVLAAAAKPDLDLSNSVWNFPSLSFRSKGSAKKLGKAKSESIDSATITLGAESGDTPTTGSFSINVAGDTLTGSYTRKNRRARTLDMTLDGPSAAALATLEEQDLEAELLGLGVDIAIDLQLDQDKSKLLMKIASKKKAGTAIGKVKASMKFTGTSTGEGVNNAPTKVTLKVKGDSNPIDDPVDDQMGGKN